MVVFCATMTNAKKTTRKTAATVYEAGKDRQILVTICPKHVEFRAVGLQTTYSLSVSRLYMMAVLADVEYRKKQKRKG